MLNYSFCTFAIFVLSSPVHCSVILVYIIQGVSKLCAINDGGASECQYESERYSEHAWKCFCKQLESVKVQEHIILQGWFS
jgi:hypothetical protein